MDQKIIEIEVTDDDIRKGRRGNCHACPIALAISRILKCPCSVQTRTVLIYGKGEADIECFLPIEASDFIFLFDNIRYTVKNNPPSFKFNLNLQNITNKQ